MTDSTRPIRALMRGLEALAALNQRDGSTVTEIANEVGLPRTTTYRILETLSEAGYVFRDPSDERYRLKARVLGLSHGFTDESWISDIAGPLLRSLSRELACPVAIATCAGTAMLVRDSVVPDGAPALGPLPPGTSLPLLHSAAGRAHLAHCPRAESEALLASLAASRRDEDRLAQNSAELQRILGEVRQSGHAFLARGRDATDESSMAVPVMAGEHVLAVLAVRFASSAVTASQAQQGFLARLQVAAAALLERHAGAAREN